MRTHVTRSKQTNHAARANNAGALERVEPMTSRTKIAAAVASKIRLAPTRAFGHAVPAMSFANATSVAKNRYIPVGTLCAPPAAWTMATKLNRLAMSESDHAENWTLSGGTTTPSRRTIAP